MNITDLTNCDKEPIHIPGKIQSHGFLLSVDKEFKIVCCSQNISRFIPVGAFELLKNSIRFLDNYIEEAKPVASIFNIIKAWVADKGGSPLNPHPVRMNGQSFNLIISTSGYHYLLEFEPNILTRHTDLQGLISRSLSEMLANVSLRELLSKGAQQIRQIIGFDRVMIYKFHEDGHGEVVAEDKQQKLPPLLGLHYPATDIPRQARELYKINLMRLIADVNEEASPIIRLRENSEKPLDLTNSALRAVSPIHIQYLKNMGVASSFSISLIHQGELWGLAACHNYTPLFINYNEREAANLVGKVLSSTLSFQQQGENQQNKHSLEVAIETLAKQLSQNDSIASALLDHEVTLLDAVNATGAIVVLDNQTYTCGNTPEIGFIEKLVAWLQKNMHGQTYMVNNLSLDLPAALEYKSAASGLLAVRISKEMNDFLIWLRPEVISEVVWAGNPEKIEEKPEEGILQISPRKSFEKWSETVRNTSVPWENEDIQSALHLKEEVSSAIIRKASETRKMNEILNEAYKTLDAFSYTISHDLKNPLTIIRAYSQMLHEHFNLEPEADKAVAGILAGTKKMESMIRHILSYSQIGQSDIEFSLINMNDLLNEIRDEILMVFKGGIQPQIFIESTPNVLAEKTMAMQVFSNLITNAVKYSGKNAESKIVISGREREDDVEYRISDNGIGIREADMDRIFELFKRSDQVREYEGSGVGLSIVKRIMEKHDGQIRVESDGKNGSTFYVTFKKHRPTSGLA